MDQHEVLSLLKVNQNKKGFKNGTSATLNAADSKVSVLD